jgi:hypothetical protein
MVETVENTSCADIEDCLADALRAQIDVLTKRLEEEKRRCLGVEQALATLEQQHYGYHSGVRAVVDVLVDKISERKSIT